MRQTLRRKLEAACGGKAVVVSKTVVEVHPIAERIAAGLSELNLIRHIKITPDFLAASSEVKGTTRDPIATPGHPTATGIAMIFSSNYKSVDFYEITAARKGKGRGREMVKAVFDALPSDWKATVTVDQSDGFWEKMRRSYHGRMELDHPESGD